MWLCFEPYFTLSKCYTYPYTFLVKYSQCIWDIWPNLTVFQLFFLILHYYSSWQSPSISRSFLDGFPLFFLGSISFVNVSLHPISIMNMFPPIVNYFPFYVFSNIFLSTYLLKNYQRQRLENLFNHLLSWICYLVLELTR